MYSFSSIAQRRTRFARRGRLVTPCIDLGSRSCSNHRSNHSSDQNRVDTGFAQRAICPSSRCGSPLHASFRQKLETSSGQWQMLRHDATNVRSAARHACVHTLRCCKTCEIVSLRLRDDQIWGVDLSAVATNVRKSHVVTHDQQNVGTVEQRAWIRPLAVQQMQIAQC